MKESNGYFIEDDQPLFGQTPQELFRDPTIYFGAKALYGNLHTYKGQKSLKRRMFRSVTQEILARDFKVHKNTIARWLKILEEAGWITIIKGGWNRPNKIILHGRKKQKRGRKSNRG